MKKLLAILMALAMLFSFAACNKDKDEDEKDEKTTVSEEVKDNKDEEEVEKTEDNADNDGGISQVPNNPVDNTSNDEADVKAAAENFVDIMLISDTSDVDDMDAELSFIYYEFFMNAYGTADFDAEFEELVGMDVETYMYYCEIDSNSQYAASWACATYIVSSIFGSFDDFANVATVEIISTDVTIDEEISAQADIVATELANEMGVSLDGAPTFTGVADALVDILVTDADGTQYTLTVELGLLKEDGQWKVVPLN